MAMTPKQARFVEEYLIDLNATQAAIRAGYGEKGAAVRGAELVRNRKTAAAIAEALSARSERTALTQDWVLGRLKENVDRAMQAEPVKDSKGALTGEYTYQGAVANTALSLIGKHLGMFVDLHADVSKLSPEERDTKVAEIVQRARARMRVVA